MSITAWVTITRLWQCLLPAWSLSRRLARHATSSLHCAISARAICGLITSTDARRSFQKALLIALDIGEIPLELLVINAMTQLWIATGQLELAIERLAMILAHPATERKVIQQAERTMAEISSMFAAEKLAEVLERGKTQSLEVVAQAILDETG